MADNYDPNQPYQMPEQAFNNFDYSQNNAMLMNSGQSNAQATMQIAQENMAVQMQNVLQGTMAASMAVYNTGKSAHEKMRETIYQDQLIGNGVYALERSTWRDVTWGTGLANSDLGRALQIGGRRPEFMTGGEYAYQMNRSWGHRKSELIEGAAAGTITAGASMLGMAVAGPMGMAAGMATGYVIDQTVGKLIQPYFEKTAAIREFSTFTEMADLNKGIGDRRMGKSASDELGSRFFERDRSAWRYVPVVGDILAERLGPQIKHEATFKKMASMDMFRDINPNDLEEIDKRVKKAAEVMDKFAGIMHTTRDAVLNMKGKLQGMGIEGDAQDRVLGNVANFHRSTGIDSETAFGLHKTFSQVGYANNLSIADGRVGASGLTSVASFEAMKQAGIISHNADPGSLGMQAFSSALEQRNNPWNRVIQYGGGSVDKTMRYLRSDSPDAPTLTFELEKLDRYKRNTTPGEMNDNFVDKTTDQLRMMGSSRNQSLQFILGTATSQGRAEIYYNRFTGMDAFVDDFKTAQNYNKAMQVQGLRQLGTYKIKNLMNYERADESVYTSRSNKDGSAFNMHKELVNNIFTDIVGSDEITRDGSSRDNNNLYELKTTFADSNKLLLEKHINQITGYSPETGKTREEIITKIEKESGKSRLDSERIYNDLMRKKKSEIQTVANADFDDDSLLSLIKRTQRHNGSTDAYKRALEIVKNSGMSKDDLRNLAFKLGDAKTDFEHEKIASSVGENKLDFRASNQIEIDKEQTQTVYDRKATNMAVLDVVAGLSNLDQNKTAALDLSWESLTKEQRSKYGTKKAYGTFIGSSGKNVRDALNNRLSDTGKKELIEQVQSIIGGNDVTYATKFTETLMHGSKQEKTGFAEFLENADTTAKNEAYAKFKDTNRIDIADDEGTRAIRLFTTAIDKLTSALGGGNSGSATTSTGAAGSSNGPAPPQNAGEAKAMAGGRRR